MPSIFEGYAQRPPVAKSGALAKNQTRLPLLTDDWGLRHPLAESWLRCCHITAGRMGWLSSM